MKMINSLLENKAYNNKFKNLNKFIVIVKSLKKDKINFMIIFWLKKKKKVYRLKNKTIFKTIKLGKESNNKILIKNINN